MASKNYPYSKSEPEGIKVDKIPANTHICYAGVSKNGENLQALGGRVLVNVGVAKTIKEARDLAYKLCDNVHFKGAKFRKDIAYQALKNA